MSDREQLHLYERIAADARSIQEKRYYQGQADILREREDLDAQMFADVINMASDPKRAGALAASIGNYPDSQQRIGRLAGALYAEKLITQAQFTDIKARLSALTPTQLENISENRAERERLESVINRVFRAVGAENKREALGEYNQIGGVRSEDKIRDWILRLIQLKMLPSSYQALFRYPDWIVKLILPGENKETLPGANK